MGIRRNEVMVVNNRLSQVGLSFRSDGKNHRREAVYECECGTRKVMLVSAVKASKTKSCGCLLGESLRNKPRITHGSTVGGIRSPAYRSWVAMRRRCADKTGQCSQRYYLRGISVCREWDSFESFLHDMGERPEGMTLERIDNDKGYEKENCCWASRTTQNRNTSATKQVVFNGVMMSLAEAVEASGQVYSRVSQRINKLGWSFEKAIATT